MMQLINYTLKEAIFACGVATNKETQEVRKNLIHVTNNEGQWCGADELVSLGKILPRWPVPRQGLMLLLHLFHLKVRENLGLCLGHGHSLGFFSILLSTRNYSAEPEGVVGWWEMKVKTLKRGCSGKRGVGISSLSVWKEAGIVWSQREPGHAG